MSHSALCIVQSSGLTQPLLVELCEYPAKMLEASAAPCSLGVIPSSASFLRPSQAPVLIHMPSIRLFFRSCEGVGPSCLYLLLPSKPLDRKRDAQVGKGYPPALAERVPMCCSLRVHWTGEGYIVLSLNRQAALAYVALVLLEPIYYPDLFRDRSRPRTGFIAEPFHTPIEALINTFPMHRGLSTYLDSI